MHLISLVALSFFLSISYAKREVIEPTSDCGLDHAKGGMQSCGDKPGHCTFDGAPYPSCLIKNDQDIGREFCDSDGDWTIILTGDKDDGTKALTGKKCSKLTPPWGGTYKWVYTQYTWECCKCPAGYQPAGQYVPHVDGIGGFTYNLTKGLVEKTCMRCTEPHETLTFDTAKEDWFCKSKSGTTMAVTTPTPTPTHTRTGTHKPTKTPTPGGGGCKTSAAGVQLIKEYTGIHAGFYSFDNAKMIGYAHNCTTFADCTTIRPPLTDASATALLLSDLSAYETCTAALPNAALLTTNQFSALVAFASSYYQSCAAMAAAFTSFMQSKDFAGMCAKMVTTNLDGYSSDEFAALRGWQSGLCKTATAVMSGC